MPHPFALIFCICLRVFNELASQVGIQILAAVGRSMHKVLPSLLDISYKAVNHMLHFFSGNIRHDQ